MTLEATLLNIFSSIPPWLAVILIAMLPIAELRLSIPIAILQPPYGFGFDPLTAFLLSIIGNMIPVIPLLLYLEPVSNYLRHWNILDNFFTFSSVYRCLLQAHGRVAPPLLFLGSNSRTPLWQSSRVF